MERASFPNYDNFHNPDIAYNNFINRLDFVVNAVAPFKIVRFKTTQVHSLMEKIADQIYMRDKLYKRFKLAKLLVDEQIYEEAQNVVQNLI